MKTGLFAVLLVASALVLASCREKAKADKTSIGPPAVGALYSLSDGEGGYRVARIIAAADDVVFVSLFANRWKKRPTLAEAGAAANPGAVAYSPPTFAGMQPVHLSDGTVTDQETEAYEAWERGKRETF